VQNHTSENLRDSYSGRRACATTGQNTDAVRGTRKSLRWDDAWDVEIEMNSGFTKTVPTPTHDFLAWLRELFHFRETIQQEVGRW